MEVPGAVRAICTPVNPIDYPSNTPPHYGERSRLLMSGVTLSTTSTTIHVARSRCSCSLIAHILVVDIHHTSTGLIVHVCHHSHSTHYDTVLFVSHVHAVA